jgi:hypothetical protein
MKKIFRVQKRFAFLYEITKGRERKKTPKKIVSSRGTQGSPQSHGEDTQFSLVKFSCKIFLDNSTRILLKWNWYVISKIEAVAKLQFVAVNLPGKCFGSL